MYNIIIKKSLGNLYQCAVDILFWNSHDFKSGYLCTKNCHYYKHNIYLAHCSFNVCDTDDVNFALKASNSYNSSSILFDKKYSNEKSSLIFVKPMMFLQQDNLLEEGDFVYKIESSTINIDPNSFAFFVFSFIFSICVILYCLHKLIYVRIPVYEILEEANESDEDIVAKLDIYENIDEENYGSDAKSCAICLEDYKANDKIAILYCNHIFHEKCINDWNETSTRCPLCNQSHDS